MATKVEKTNAELLDLVRALNTTPVEKGSKAEVKLKKIAEKSNQSLRNTMRIERIFVLTMLTLALMEY